MVAESYEQLTCTGFFSASAAFIIIFTITVIITGLTYINIYSYTQYTHIQKVNSVLTRTYVMYGAVIMVSHDDSTIIIVNLSLVLLLLLLLLLLVVVVVVVVVEKIKDCKTLKFSHHTSTTQ